MIDPVGLEEYISADHNIRFRTLVTAVSYERRGYQSLKKLLERFQFDKVILISFGYSHLDDSLRKKWAQQLDSTMNLLDDSGIDYSLVNANLLSCQSVFDLNKKPIDLYPTIINISTFPKNWIMQLARQFDDVNNLFFYQQSGYRNPTEKELNTGVERIIPIEGFEGEKQIRAEDLLVLLLGFEGNRALSFLSIFSPYRILPLVGLPRIKEWDSIFSVQVEQCNTSLLRRHSVIKNKDGHYYSVSSLNHISFCKELEEIVAPYLGEELDICISPLGTKPQTLGLYLFWRKYPTTQIIYSLPTIRMDITDVHQDKLYGNASGINDKEDGFWLYRLPKIIFEK